MAKSEAPPSNNAQKEPECLNLVKQPRMEALPKEQTNLAENEENNDRLVNTGVVDDPDFGPLLEEMPLNELHTPLQIPQSIGRASILIEDGFKAFQRRKPSLGGKLQRQRVGQSERWEGSSEREKRVSITSRSK